MLEAESFSIRGMTESDLDEVLAVERLCYSHPWTEDHFRNELTNPFAAVDLLITEEGVVGYLCSWYLHGELEILNVATAPPFRRRGVAHALLEHVLGRSRKQALRKGYLEVRAGNLGAIALYEAHGFKVTARRPGYYPDGEDALLMER